MNSQITITILITLSFLQSACHSRSGYGSRNPDPAHDRVRVSVGYVAACGVGLQGTIRCWGNDRFGLLGDGGLADNTPGPVQVFGISDAVDVAVTAGRYHGSACALHREGSVSCWGKNTYGQLGDATTVDSPVPVPVTNLSQVVELVAGRKFFCARKTDETVWCWGQGTGGQLGSASLQDAAAPVQVQGIDNAIRLDSSGYAQHACALLSDATVACWGSNSNGQLAQDAITESSVPLVVSELNEVTEIGVGGAFTCAQNSAGTHCWGENDAHQLGVATPTLISTPTLVAGSESFVELYLGADNACAVDTERRLFCWGDDTYNNLLQGQFLDSAVPVLIEELGPVASVSLSGYTGSRPPTTLCAVTMADQIRCWGFNRDGQDGTGTRSAISTPQLATLMADATDVVFSHGFACSLRSGQVWCHGSNLKGGLGTGDTIARAFPTEVPGLSSVVAIDTGIHWHLHGMSVCAKTSSNEAYCWGNNGGGQLGFALPSFLATPVIAPVSGISQIRMGDGQACALLLNGEVWCWGLNRNGQLGNGTFSGSYVPVQAGLPRPAIYVAAYFRHVCALLDDQRLYCWGEGDYGEIGNGEIGNINTPREVVGITTATGVAVGGEHSCGILADGTARCWGANNNGQLGDNGSGSQSTPVTVLTQDAATPLDQTTAVALGAGHSCVLRTDQTVWCWGSNGHGQLGRTAGNSYVAGPVPGISDAVEIFAGGENTCAKRVTGELYCWGSNQFGELASGGSFLVPSTVQGFP